MSNTFTESNRERSRAPAVDRAMAILKLLAHSAEPKGISDLSRDMGVSKGSVHAIVHALRDAGAVEDAPGQKFRLGRFVDDLSVSRRGRLSLTERCRPAMEGLRDATGQTVMLGVIDGDSLKVLSVMEGDGALRLRPAPGMTLPLTGGATGKVAFVWGGREIPQALRDQPGFGPGELNEIKASRVSLDRGEWMKGVAAAAAPILSGQTLKAILFAVGFRDELDEQRLAALGEAVGAAAAELSATRFQRQ